MRKTEKERGKEGVKINDRKGIIRKEGGKESKLVKRRGNNNKEIKDMRKCTRGKHKIGIRWEEEKERVEQARKEGKERKDGRKRKQSK